MKHDISLQNTRIAVLGAGHGGQAMAGHLGILGYQVSLYNRSDERLEAIRNIGGINVTGKVQGFGPVHLASSNIEEALDNALLILVVVPATAHKYIAQEVAPWLSDGQIILLNPGRTGGALEFKTTLKQVRCKADVTVCEAQTLIYASRCSNPAQVQILRIKNTIPVAAFPAYRTVDALKVINQVYPQFVPGDNVLKTSLNNIGAIFHPAITILNAARIESTHGEFEFYMDGITPSVAKILEALDTERVKVASALGIRAMSAREWLYIAYDAAGDSLYQAIQLNHGYRGIKAPPTINHRYITEDVPTSLVPIASIGNMLGVKTQMMQHIIDLCSHLHGVDYWEIGRKAESLGLAGLSVRAIRRLVLEGDETGEQNNHGVLY